MTKSDFIGKVIEKSGIAVDNGFLTKLKAEEMFVIEEGGVVHPAEFYFALSNDGKYGNFQISIVDQLSPVGKQEWATVEEVKVAEGSKFWITLSGKNSVGYKVLAQDLTSYTGNGSIGPVSGSSGGKESVTTTLTLSAESGTVTIGTPVDVTVTTNAKDFSVESSDNSKATVAKNSGKFTITGVAAGSANITVKAKAEGGKEVSKVYAATIQQAGASR